MKRVSVMAGVVLVAGVIAGLVPASASAASTPSTPSAPDGISAARAVSESQALAAASASHLIAATGRPAVSSVSPAAGPVGGGTTITVHGARFASGASVSVGGKAARSVHVKSTTVLTAVTPAHAAGGATVVVKEKTGTSAGNVRFEYLNKPVLTGLSAHSGPVTGDQVVTITGRNFSYVTAVLFGTLRATVLPGATATQLKVRTPASWAATVNVAVQTRGGATARSASGRFSFLNPKAQATGQVTAATGTSVAAGTEVTAVSGGPGVGLATAPWTVTLAAATAVPAVGQGFLLKPGGTVYPGGLAGTVTAVNAAAGTITVAPASLATTVTSATATFTGPLGDASAAVGQGKPDTRAGGPSLTSEIDFGSIDASELACDGLDGKSVSVTGSFSLTLENVEAHVEVDAGSLFTKPYVDVWVTYDPTVSFSIEAADEATCQLPAAWQNEHSKLFFLGDTGATIAIAPDASFTVSVGGSVTFEQHSYRILGFESNADGSLTRLDGESSDPAQVHVSAALTATAYGGVQIQVGELNVIGVGMSIGGGVTGKATSHWPPQVCLSAHPFLRGTLYAYLNAWVEEWKLQSFQVELDFAGISSCDGEGWHVAWHSTSASVNAITCPTAGECLAVGGEDNRSYILRTTDGGTSWAATAGTASSLLYLVACSDAQHCVAAGDGGALVATANSGASWSKVTLPSISVSPLGGAEALACAPGGTCYLFMSMTKYSNSVVFSSSNGGRTWKSGAWPDDAPVAMTCLNSSECLAVGSVPPTYGSIVWPMASLATRDGDSWTAAEAKGWESATSVSCTGLSLCFAPAFDAVGANGKDMLATTNFGKSWAKVSVPLELPWAVSCPGASTCVVGGSAANWAQQVATTYDGGHSWTTTTISDYPESDSMNMYALDCPALGHCAGIEYGDTGLSAIVVS
ncbi:MAG: Ig family protein [Actinomycetia bacterium]|nr:Ig family protein [Actinomycetes bacterium]